MADSLQIESIETGHPVLDGFRAPPSHPSTLRERLIWAMERKSIAIGSTVRQSHLGRVAGVSAAAVSAWMRANEEAGNGISADQAIKIGAYLNVAPDWLRFGRGSPDDPQRQPIDPGTFGQRLKRAREDRGITCAELGEVLGCREVTIEEYESRHGVAVPAGDVFRIADHLGVSSRFLLIGEDEAPSAIGAQRAEQALACLRAFRQGDNDVALVDAAISLLAAR